MTLGALVIEDRITTGCNFYYSSLTIGFHCSYIRFVPGIYIEGEISSIVVFYL